MILRHSLICLCVTSPRTRHALAARPRCGDVEKEILTIFLGERAMKIRKWPNGPILIYGTLAKTIVVVGITTVAVASFFMGRWRKKKTQEGENQPKSN